MRVHFEPADKFFNIANKVFRQQRARILELISNADVQHIGSTVIPASRTKGDLDINIRVRKEDFKPSIEKLKKLYDVNQPENWTESFASFKDEKNLGINFGAQLTVIGSGSDDFIKLRDILINNPILVGEFNKLKADFEGKDMEEYRKAKADFFQKLRTQSYNDSNNV